MSHLHPDIPILYFHSVAPHKYPGWNRNFLTLELHFFESFLRYLHEGNWKSVFLDEYFQIKKNRSKPPKHTFCLTFDDGFLDNYIYVFPLLKKYDFKGTIFINPEFVDLKRSPAVATLWDVWENKVDLQSIYQWGYLSWSEMKIMQNSGVIDIQSHTMTHTKYFVSDELIDFHHPGADCLYPVGNIFPERKPYYHLEKDFQTLLPFGTPFFKSESSIIANRVFINPLFERKIVEILSDFNWEIPHANQMAYKKVFEEYVIWRKGNKIIEDQETQEEKERRLFTEIAGSKKIIEQELKKKVEFLCWPHGDNDEKVHQMALEMGYLATTTGSKQKIEPSNNRISLRTSIGIVKENLFLTNLKTRFRMESSSGNRIMKGIQTLFHKIN
jgi:hypothetical protein